MDRSTKQAARLERAPPSPMDAVPYENRKPVRFDEPAKFLPILFLVATIAILYSIYVFSHLSELLQLEVKRRHRDEEMFERGVAQCGLFHYFTILLLICYIRCILTHPGEIPQDDPRWMYLPDNDLAARMANQEKLPQPAEPYELKKSGDRRHCKWCSKYKPDRTHHCRVCRTCILKMDHHCPWIYNCVGFRNYKYFFLLILYGVILTHFICWTIWESMMAAVEGNAPFVTMFLRVFGLTLAFWMALVLTLFFLFHMWLMFKAMTIIEFCEKSASKNSDADAGSSWWPGSSYRSAYDRGCYGNICAVLGDNPLLWFFPVAPPAGDGMIFPRPKAAGFEQYKLPKVRSRGPLPDSTGMSNARLLNPPMSPPIPETQPAAPRIPGSDGGEWPRLIPQSEPSSASRLIPQSGSSLGTSQLPQSGLLPLSARSRLTELPPSAGLRPPSGAVDSLDYTFLPRSGATDRPPMTGATDRPPMTDERPGGRQGMSHSPSMPYAPQPRMLDDSQVVDPSLYDPRRQREAPAAPVYQP